MACPFEIGDRVHLTPQFKANDKILNSKFYREWKSGVDFKVLLITPIFESRQYQHHSAPLFDVAGQVFGAETQVLWLVDEQRTFYDKAMTQVNGFPILYTPAGEFLGVDGAPFKIDQIKAPGNSA